ncbi:hypothetical protein D9Q98_000671 [Chlorella vulgaris]|uniref:Importin N-terminal domain-containing protein n=1 Tax=Chlorella vulgaris TaxID=3077 RepID=A0A9D4Z1S9_CHLVU|nr:hypothetical protein D9Q98_000671 [Chlorella vulgaris]
MASPEQVVAALHALYHANDTTQQAQANDWLTSFQRSDAAWQVPFVLLVPQQPDEVQFFAATLLVRKVRSEWTKLDAPSRQGLNQAIRTRFQEVLGWPRVGDLVLRQQCCLLAAVSGASGGEGASELVSQALGLLPSNSLLALRLLTALAEEAEELDRARRLALVNVLLPRARELLGALGALLASAEAQLRSGDSGPAATATAGLQCAEAWLALNPVAGSGCCFTPGELHQQHGGLFGAVLALLACGGGSSDELLEAAVQLLLLVFGPEGYSSDDAPDQAAMSALAQALLACRGRLTAPGSSDTLPAGVAKLAAALAERWPDFCCGSMPEAGPLSDLMLLCLERPGPDMACHTVDYFLMANTVPLAERPPQMRAPLYEAVLQRLVPHASYPPTFTSWEEESELDEDAFGRLREQFLPELLDVAYGLLRLRYLTLAWQLLEAAPSWQTAEAALLLLTAVSLGVKTRVLSDSGGNGGDENSGGGAAVSPAVAEDRRQTGELLAKLFARVCSSEGGGSMLGSHPLLAAATCRLVERYSAWFGRAGGEVPLQGAFQLLLAALPIPAASHVAAQAFQQLCLRCSWKLKDPAAFAWLTEVALAALQHAGGGLPIADRQLVVEGLARVAAGLRGQQLQDAVALLTAPFLQQAQQAASAGAAAPDSATRRSLTHALLLLAAALRFLAPAGDDSGEVGGQPAARVLGQAAPTLRLVSQSPAWQADREAMAAVVEVHRRAIGTARQHGLQLTLVTLPAMATLFAATALPDCLDVAREAVELQSEEPQVAAAALQALEAACGTAAPLLQGGGLRDSPALVSALLALADRCTLATPTAMWCSLVLPPLLQLAVAAVGLREADPVLHALEFIGKLVQTGCSHQEADQEGVTPAHLHASHRVLMAQGPGLVAALLAAVCDTCPRHLMRNAADCIRRMLLNPALTQQTYAWLAAAASSSQLPGVADGYLSAEDCATFAAVAPRLRGPRFLALVLDFGLIARGHNTSDVLLAYEL